MSSDAMHYLVGALAGSPDRQVELDVTDQSELVDREDSVGVSTELRISRDTDEALLEAVGKQDREALSSIFQKYGRRVRNVAYRILRDEQEAEDLVQEVFLFIFRNAGQFDPKLGSASSWIIHIAYHRAFDRRRYLISRHFYDGDELKDSIKTLAATRPVSLPSSGTMLDFLGKDLMKRYEQRLSSDQRSVIELYFFVGHTFDEIAEIRGTTRISVRSHYYRGLDRLRRYVLPEKFRTQ